MNGWNLGDLANLASVATAAVAIWAYGRFLCTKRRKRILLEDYLRDERPGKRGVRDQGSRTILHLVGALGMSEADILEAAFDSKSIKRAVAADPDTGRADCIYLRYSN